MRLTCSQRDLLSALTTTNKAVDVNNTLPVLNNVYLKAEGKKLYFTSTNLEIAISYTIETDIKNEGEITIPSKLFTNYISYLKDEKVEILAEAGDVRIETSDSKTRIKGIPATEFPPIPSVEKEGGMSVSVKELNQAIEQVVFAAALNTTRPILSGVYFAVEKNELKMVSTDSYRLSEKIIAATKVSGSVTCIVPAKTILELGSILDGLDEKDMVEVVVSKNQIQFSVGPVQLISRLIEGQFPNYEQIIPKETKTKVEFEVSPITLVLKRINIFAKENNNKIILKVVGGKVVVTTESTQYGEGEITLDTKIEGKDNEIALNSQFLLDALGNIGSSKITFEIGEKTTPVVLKPKEGSGYTHIIMPLKI